MSTWQVGYEECLKNVDQYINDVRTLIDRKSYGHAFSLAILAKEELAKATSYFIVSSGVIDANDKAGKKLLKLLHSKHELKIGFAYLLLFVPEMISKLKDHVKKSKLPTREERIRDISIDLFDSSIIPLVSKMVDEHKRKWRKIQKLKLKGFYVDIDKNGTIITPDKFTEDEVATQLKELKENRKIIGELPLWLNQVSPQDSLTFKEVMKEFVWTPIAKKLERSKI